MVKACVFALRASRVLRPWMYSILLLLLLLVGGLTYRLLMALLLLCYSLYNYTVFGKDVLRICKLVLHDTIRCMICAVCGAVGF